LRLRGSVIVTELGSAVVTLRGGVTVPLENPGLWIGQAAVGGWLGF
jgi:hypothetical protein